jgi:hypothetical protein
VAGGGGEEGVGYCEADSWKVLGEDSVKPRAHGLNAYVFHSGKVHSL